MNACFVPLDDLSGLSLVEALSSPDAYRSPVSKVKVHETHISWVFLAGEFAYKVKKPIKTDFLDYSTMERRKNLCEEEVRLDRRYASDLYIGVVPIAMDLSGHVSVEGDGDPIDYAVKMHRFADDALLSHRIDSGRFTTNEVGELAITVAKFHVSAQRCRSEQALQVPSLLIANMKEIQTTLETEAIDGTSEVLDVLHDWSRQYFTEHRHEFFTRAHNGFVRECHGDLHLQNIVNWRGKLVPFDGIEFNDDFRWIDVISDAAFLVMDLTSRGHMDLSRLFLSSYLEHTGDYSSLVVLRWYLVYRSLIRAMVAKMKVGQHQNEPKVKRVAEQDCRDHIDLAYQFTLIKQPTLFITHGLSGSGKTTRSQSVVERHGAIRLRSDIERKRLFVVSPDQPVDAQQRKTLYSHGANQATYNRLETLTKKILRAGYPVIIDATFLKKVDRARFREIAQSEMIPFAILDCRANDRTLRQRIAKRIAAGNDASDADAAVLDLQIQAREDLTPEERASVVAMPISGPSTDHL